MVAYRVGPFRAVLGPKRVPRVLRKPLPRIYDIALAPRRFNLGGELPMRWRRLYDWHGPFPRGFGRPGKDRNRTAHSGWRASSRAVTSGNSRRCLGSHGRSPSLVCVVRQSWRGGPTLVGAPAIALDARTVHGQFADCATTAGADYLLTENAHFAPLADASYKPRPLSPQQFVAQFVASAR